MKRGNGFFCFFLLACLVIMLFRPDPVGAVEDEYEADILQAAHAGDASSQYALALLYEYGGSSLERNPQQSIIWLEKAGREAVAGACLYLGLKYEYGNGVEQDFSKARCWYTCAAQQDWPVAQFFLAGLYENGKGGPASSLKALAWLGLASESWYPGAEKAFSRLLHVTGFKNMVQLQVEQDLLMHARRTPCN